MNTPTPARPALDAMAEASPNETAGDEQRTQTMIDTNPVIMAIRALDER